MKLIFKILAWMTFAVLYIGSGVGCVNPSQSLPTSSTSKSDSSQEKPKQAQSVTSSPVSVAPDAQESGAVLEVKAIIANARVDMGTACSNAEFKTQKETALSLLQGLEDRVVYQIHDGSLTLDLEVKADIAKAAQEPKALCVTQ